MLEKYQDLAQTVQLPQGFYFWPNETENPRQKQNSPKVDKNACINPQKKSTEYRKFAKQNHKKQEKTRKKQRTRRRSFRALRGPEGLQIDDLSFSRTRIHHFFTPLWCLFFEQNL